MQAATHPAETLLFIDAGNSRLKWQLFEIAEAQPWTCLASGVMPASAVSESAVVDLGVRASRAVWLCSNPCLAPLLEEGLQACLEASNVQALSAKAITATFGLDASRYSATLGIDRLWQGALLACEPTPAHCEGEGEAPVLLLSLGTAATLDGWQGRTFLGGWITLGWGPLQSGFQASLPHVALEGVAVATAALPPTFPRSTQQAVQAGLVQLYLGGLLHLLEQARAALPLAAPLPLLYLTGGDADFWRPYLQAHWTGAIRGFSDSSLPLALQALCQAPTPKGDSLA